jgi:hypothetical protein
MSMVPFSEEKIVDARSCIKDLADGRIGHEKVMLRYYDLVERGEPTPELDPSIRKILERIHLHYNSKEPIGMVDPENTEKRPYELTGDQYAAWYDVGAKMGMSPQHAISHALCGGSMKLPEDVDPYTAYRIIQIAAARGVTITAA